MISRRVELDQRIREFERHIWDHTQDQFQQGFDIPPPVDEKIRRTMTEFAHFLKNEKDEQTLIQRLRDDIKVEGTAYFDKLLQFSGLTRNKILTDLRAMVADHKRRVRIPSSYTNLTETNVWPLAGKYLLDRLRPILRALIYDSPDIIIESLNHATWPGWIRQERAKRQGHEAEGRLAKLLKDIGIPFEPLEKVDNPMSRDVQLFDVSYDLILPSSRKPKICVKSTVHTANIGQYGESKDHLEIDEAKRVLDENFSSEDRPLLLALVDGVGFHSNRAGLEGVLSKSDEFCQFKTLWKSVLIAESIVKRIPDIKLFLPKGEKTEYRQFIEKYNWTNRVFEGDPKGIDFTVKAGEGIFSIQKSKSVNLDTFNTFGLHSQRSL